jgi:tetratricopeptide (TPR) repeat protein
VLSNRICKAAFAALAFVAISACAALAGSLEEAAGIFLSEAKILPEAAKVLLGKIGESAHTTAYVADVSAGTYSFYAAPAPSDGEADVRAALERARMIAAAIRARANLLLFVASGRLDRKIYSDGEALGGAFISFFTSKGVSGVQSASDVSDGWVMSLAWMERGTADAYRAFSPVSADINDGYCAALYAGAKRDFDAGRYADALPVFKKIHDLKWADTGAYLDAAECFLRSGEPGESKKLLAELVETLGDDMSSDELARAGDLFRESGDKKSAEKAYVLALERYRQMR